MSGSYKIEQMRSILKDLGHDSNADVLPDYIIENWFESYMARFNIGALDPTNPRDKKILDVLVDNIILVESDNETESNHR